MTLQRVASGSIAAAQLPAGEPHHGPASASLPETILDTSIVEELSRIKGAGDTDLFTDLADQFLREMPAWLRELEKAARDHDTNQARRQAHRLLGLCRQMGVERMAALCSSIEQSHDETTEKHLVEQVSRLQAEFDAAYRALDDRYLLHLPSRLAPPRRSVGLGHFGAV